jgi:hypothetical protein
MARSTSTLDRQLWRGLVERGAAVGANDTASAAAAIALPLLAGPAGLFGLSALGVLGVSLVVPPVVLLLTRLKETSDSARESW